MKSHLIKNTNIEMTVLDYGGIIQSLKVPDKNGKMADIVLGFDQFQEYEKGHPYFGALIGRYANRISKGMFSIDQHQYQLNLNNGPHSLHGGIKGFDKVFWDVKGDDHSLELYYTSKDNEEGYPGEVKVKVTYTLTSACELIINYRASSTRATPLNLTNHSYFNLNNKVQNILEHELFINALHYTEVDEYLIPSGRILPVDQGPMDFRAPHPIGLRINDVPGGYDHNFVLHLENGRHDVMMAASLYEPHTGRFMEVHTTEPGIQFYSGNFLDGSILGKKGIPLQRHAGLCLETQHFPDSPNHSKFPCTILRPGKVWQSTTIYRFKLK